MRRKAILVDLDQTLSIPGKRNTWDQTYCHHDLVHEPTKKIVRDHFNRGFEVIILTARPVECSKATRWWLKKHNINYSILLMKPWNQSKDGESALEWKKRAYLTMIEDRWHVQLVLDDDPEVCVMFAELHLPVTQVVH